MVYFLPQFLVLSQISSPNLFSSLCLYSSIFLKYQIYLLLYWCFFHCIVWFLFYFFLKILFIFREKEKERERNINDCISHAPPPGTWCTTQACALTGNRTSDSLVHRLALNPLSHTSQGTLWDSFKLHIQSIFFSLLYFSNAGFNLFHLFSEVFHLNIPIL